MDEKWICNTCEKQFTDPEKIYGDEYCADGAVAYVCPFCEEADIEQMEPCDNCHIGWKRIGHDLCEDCEKKTLGELKFFSRSLSVQEAKYIDELMDGNSIFDYR